MPTSPDPAAPVPQNVPTEGDTQRGAAVDGPPMQRRLWFLIPLGGMSISLIWGGVIQALIATQVATLSGGSGEAQAAVLGAVLTLSSISSVVFNPIVGRLSDKTRARFLGRRNIWILGGAIFGAVMMIASALSPNVVYLAIVWALAIIPLNGYQAALVATIPERVPVFKRARLSAVHGMAGVVGIGGGAAIGASAATPLIGYAILAIQLVVVAAVFAFTTRDASARVVSETEGPMGKSPLLNFRENADFWWAFAGRFLSFAAYGLATGLQLFSLRDHFGAGDLDAARATLPTITLVSTALLVVSSIVGGIVADKTGRMKFFAVVSSAVFVPAGIILAFVPSPVGAILGFAVLGFGFGAYVAIDGALITRVIPDVDNAGRDLGILNIANAGPGIITPVVGGAIVAAAGYSWLFIIMVIVAALGSIAVTRIRSIP